jgi:benzodiazapine receptor
MKCEAEQPASQKAHLSVMSGTKPHSLLVLAGFGLLTAGAAWAGVQYSRTGRRSSSYRERPQFNSTGTAYPIIWTTLLSLVAWSGWRVWNASPSRGRETALQLWIAQLAAHARWAKLLLREDRPRLALADAVALESQVVSYIMAARKVDRMAANAVIPYGFWVAFTTLMNAEIDRRSSRAA